MTRVRLTPHRVELPDGESLYVEEQGAGPALLLLTGLGYGLWSWEPVVGRLARRWRTITLDNRGSGRSSKPPTGYAIGQAAEDVTHVLRQLAAVPAHVVGFSMGGYVALTLAAQQPEAVRSLVLLGTTVGGPGHTGVPEETLTCWHDHRHLEPEAYARATMPLSFSPHWCEEHPAEYARILRRRLAHPTPMSVWLAQFEACAAFLSEGADTGAVRCPVLIVHGDRDRVVPVANAEHSAKRLSGARTVILAGRGHLAHLEDPDGFADAVEPFLEQADP